MKVKIIHRTYPPGTPQVILDLEAKLRAGAEFVPGIVRRVAKRYQDLLLQNVLFKGKLQDLTVVIHPSDEDAHANHTGGDCTTALKGERLCPEIHLYVNIADSAKFIAFVFAHELTHMLLNTQLDRCRISGSSKEGCRPGLSSVNRYLPTEPDVFGTGMEESIADTIAMYVVSRCRFSDEAGTYRRCINQWKSRQGFAPLLAAAYGDPLEACKYIDEFTEQLLSKALREEDETGEPEEYVSFSIRNIFWYCVAINQFYLIVDAYNDIMGEGAWRELCRHMDAVQGDIHGCGCVSEDAVKHQKQAEALIREFVRRSQEENP